MSHLTKPEILAMETCEDGNSSTEHTNSGNRVVTLRVVLHGQASHSAGIARDNLLSMSCFPPSHGMGYELDGHGLLQPSTDEILKSAAAMGLFRTSQGNLLNLLNG